MMNRFILFLLVVLLSGCAAAPSNEQEGGIAGTGYSSNCSNTDSKQAPSCLDVDMR